MAKNTVPRGETSVIRHVFIMDSTSTAGAGKTALAYNTASLTAYYIYPGGTAISLTLEDITTLGTYAAPTSAAHIRFKKIDDANMPGWYELHFHNDWFSVANTRRAVGLQLKGATGMAPLNLEMDCIGFGIQAAEPNVNTKTLDNDAITAAAIANGAIDAATFAADVAALVLGYIVDDATKIDASALNTATGTSIPAILDDTGTAGVVVAAASKTGYTLTATTGLGNQTANITGNLSGSVGSVTAGVALTAGERATLAAAIEAAIINELDGTAVMQAIADLIASDMTTTDLTVAAIASAARDAILNRVLAGNHDTAGSVGKVLQDVLEDTGTTLPSTLTTITGYVDCLPVSWVTVPTAAQNSTQVASDLAAAHGAGSWATATSVTVSDKTGFKLASDGLDSVATTAPTGPAANFREMVVQTWRRWFKKATRTYTGGTQQIVTYADNGTTPITTQTISDDATTETQGTAA